MSNSRHAFSLDRNAAMRGAAAVRDALTDRLGDTDARSQVDGLLSDLIPEHPTERRLLVAAYRLGVVRELRGLAGRGGSRQVERAFVSRLRAEHFSESGARFAVGVWRDAIAVKQAAGGAFGRQRRHGLRAAVLLIAAAILGSLIAAAVTPKRRSQNARAQPRPTPTVPAVSAHHRAAEATSTAAPAVVLTPPAPSPPPSASPATRQWTHAGMPGDHPSEERPWPGRRQRVEAQGAEAERGDGPRAMAGPWLPLDGDKGEHAHHRLRITLHRLGWVSFLAPSRSLFWLTSPTNPRPIPDGTNWVVQPTRRTVSHRAAKCHISRATRSEIAFAWFYESDGLWLVDAWAVTEQHGVTGRGLFVYQTTDGTWWRRNAPTAPSSDQPYSARGPDAVAAARSYVLGRHLADGGVGRFNDFRRQQTEQASVAKSLR